MKVVEIIWLDHTNISPQWQLKEEAGSMMFLNKTYSYGVIVNENKEVLQLARDYIAESDRWEETYGNIINIGKKDIVKINKIKEIDCT